MRSSRRPAKGASASRSRGGSCTRRAAASASTRWRSSCDRRATTSACSITRSIAPAFRLVRSRHPRPHPAGRAFLAHARVRGRASVGDPVRRIPVARPGAGRRRGRARTRARRAATMPSPASRASKPEPDELEDAARSTARSGGRGQPVVAGTLRAPWKWEKLIVESAVIGGDPERWHRRLRGLRGEFDEQLREEEREDPDSPRVRRLERDSPTSRTWRRSRCRSIDDAGGVAATATWGDWLARFEELAPRVLRRPGACCACSASCGRWRRSVRSRSRKCATSSRAPADARRASAGAPLWRVFVGSPHQARGRVSASCSCPAWPSGCSRRSRAKIRCCSTRRCASRSTPGCRPGGSPQDRASAAAPGRRRGHRALWLSYPRIDVGGARPRVPSFYVLDIMRAITGHIPQHEELQRRRRGGGRREAGLAGAGGCRRRHRRGRARSRDAARADRTARPRGGAGPRALPARLNDALRRSVTPLGARAIALVPQDGLVVAGDAIKPMLGVAAARRAAVLVVGAAEVRDLSRTSSCSRRSIGSSRTTSRSRCSGSIR